MSYNSTIRQKQGICYLCAGTEKKPLIKNLCSLHYWQSIRQKSALKAQEKELEQDEDVKTLVNDLDIIFSRYIRLSHADEFGNVCCVTCGVVDNWKQMDNGHFIPRQHMYTRFSEDNCWPQCQHCNRVSGGRIAAFAQFLELNRPGSVEMLQEQARIVHKYGKDELKSMIAVYSNKLKQVKK